MEYEEAVSTLLGSSIGSYEFAPMTVGVTHEIKTPGTQLAQLPPYDVRKHAVEADVCRGEELLSGSRGAPLVAADLVVYRPLLSWDRKCDRLISGPKSG